MSFSAFLFLMFCEVDKIIHFAAYLIRLSFYLQSSSAIASISASFASLREDMIFTLFSNHVMFLLFSNIPCITLAAAGAQLPFSMRPMVRFW